jgi:hypothetical protein
MNVKQLKVKFLELKVNLKNPRTLEKLREYHYDRVVIIYTYFILII